MRRIRLGVTVAIVLCAAGAAAAQERPTVSRIELDPTFGKAGRVTSIGRGRSRIDGVSRVVVDPAGRLVVAGSRWAPGPPSRSVPAVARLRPDGTLDPTFGRRGVRLLPGLSYVTGMALDASGRIVVAGEFRQHILDMEIHAARLTPDGEIDVTFATGGYLAVGSPVGMFSDVGIDPTDGSLRFLADTDDGFVVLRADAAGAIDATFSGDGIAEIGDRVGNIAVDAAGGTLVGRFAGIFRLDRRGERDLEFGEVGTLRGRYMEDLGPVGMPLRTTGSPAGGEVHVDREGRVVVLGEYEGFDRRFPLYRFLANGDLDRAFREPWYGLPTPDFPGSPSLAVGESTYVMASGPTWFIEAIGADAPCDVASIAQSGGLAGDVATTALFDVVVLPGDAKAVAVGVRTVSRRNHDRYSPILLRVDLTARTPVEIPELSVRWVGAPVVSHEGWDASIQGTLDVTNAGPGRTRGARVLLYFSEDDAIDRDGTDLVISGELTGALAPGRSLRVPFTALTYDIDLIETSGRYLFAEVVHATSDLESNPDDDVAVFGPLP